MTIGKSVFSYLKINIILGDITDLWSVIRIEKYFLDRSVDFQSTEKYTLVLSVIGYITEIL